MTCAKDKRNKIPKEGVFLGNSVELKVYLITKKKYFEEFVEKNYKKLESEQIYKIRGFVEVIEEMLEQKYFIGNRVYSMPELIEEIKIERDELLIEIEAIKSDVESAKEKAYDAYKEVDGYYANKYEDIYDTRPQRELRYYVDEYQALCYQIECLEKCRKVLHRLLGVIHRPIGFFEKVFEV